MVVLDSFSKATLFPDVNAIYRFAWVYSINKVSQLRYFAVFSGGYICTLALTSANSVDLLKLSIIIQVAKQKMFPGVSCLIRTNNTE